MQPYTFPLLQTHLCRNDPASAQGSFLPSSAPFIPPIFTRPLFLEPTSILSLPPLLSLLHRAILTSLPHIFQPSPSRIQAFRAMTDTAVIQPATAAPAASTPAIVVPAATQPALAVPSAQPAVAVFPTAAQPAVAVLYYPAAAQPAVAISAAS